jgi:hypothetical protein
MAVAWDQFYPYIQPHLPGCPELTIEKYLQEAAAEFCAQSGVWRYDIDKDYTSRNTAEYDIEVPTNAVLEDILVLYINGQPTKRVSDRHYDLPSTISNGRPMSYSLYIDSQVRFYPTPDGKYEFEGVAVIKPSLSASGVEDFIYESYGRHIACGAIYRLAMIPGKEWSNPELGVYYKTEFYNHIAQARGRDTRRVNLTAKLVGFDRATARRGL